jgi:hypothetical protein
MGLIRSLTVLGELCNLTVTIAQAQDVSGSQRLSMHRLFCVFASRYCSAALRRCEQSGNFATQFPLAPPRMRRRPDGQRELLPHTTG